MVKKPITVSAGKRGGTKTASTHQHEFYQEIGRKGGSERAKQREGSKEAEGKISIEESLNRGRQRFKRLIELGKKHEKEQ